MPGRFIPMRVSISLSQKHTTLWPETLKPDDIRQLRTRAKPIDEYVVKIHSRCNLACDYCYIYEMGDDTWRKQPGSMSLEVAMQSAERIAEHAETHQLESVLIVLHGGEPLLVGPKRLEQLLMIFQTTLSYVTRPLFGLQTNGLLLTGSTVQILHHYNVAVSVSIDGGMVANDRHRKRRNGSGSYNDVVQRLLDVTAGPYATIIGGLLATIDLQNSAIATYEDLRALPVPYLDFLLPHGNWSKPPADLEPRVLTPYADWLIEIFDHRQALQHRTPGIRMFDEIVRLHRGLPTRWEFLGLEPVGLAVIETDGSYELVDTMKSTTNGAAATGLDVFEEPIDTLLDVPSVAVRQMSMNGLCTACRDCDIVSMCGGGYFPHRYDQQNGFLNRSVFCEDLYKLVRHVGTSLRLDRDGIGGK